MENHIAWKTVNNVLKLLERKKKIYGFIVSQTKITLFFALYHEYIFKILATFSRIYCPDGFDFFVCL